MDNFEGNTSKSFKEVEFEFHARNDVPVSIWIEPSCQNIDVEPGFDYKLIAWENCFRLEFDKKKVSFCISNIPMNTSCIRGSIAKISKRRMSGC